MRRTPLARTTASRPRRGAAPSLKPQLKPLVQAVTQTLAGACLLASPLWLQAQTVLPAGLQAVQGQASVVTKGAQMTVRNSPNAILNWQSFSIGAANKVYFDQASVASKVLNRVTGNEPSAIFGSLASNGQVWLLNPNGVLFGANARVDVAGLVTSTLRLNDNDFLAGRFRFSTAEGDAGSVRNEGSLKSSFGGQIVLLGSRVENTGSIEAPGGSVSLAAARSVELVDTGLPNLAVRVAVPAGEVLNIGRLSAAGGLVDVYAAIVNQQGLVQADTLGTDALGRVVLQAADTLTLAAGSRTQAAGMGAGQAGGQVTLDAGQLAQVHGTVDVGAQQAGGGGLLVQGTRILLGATALLDASGATGGGLVRVGGDFQGKNPLVKHAEMVAVAQGAVLKANATGTGDGGRVIVWSDGATRFGGSADARGGALGGDGGLVEVSSKGYLDYRGSSDRSAVKGRAGRLLLDPTNLAIEATSPDVNGDGSGGDDLSSPFLTFAAPGVNSVITASAVSSQLGSGPVILQATNNVSVNAAGISGNNALTLEAGNNLSVNAAISLGSGSTLTLSANTPGGGGSGTGFVTLNAPVTANSVFVTNNGGSGTHQFASNITATTLDVNGTINLTATNIWALSGFASIIANNIVGTAGLIKAGAGSLELAAPNSYNGDTTVNAGVLRVNSAGALGNGGLTLNGGTLRASVNDTLGMPVTLGAGGGTFDVDTGRKLALGGGVTGVGALTISGSGTLALAVASSYSGITNIAASGTLSVGDVGSNGSVGSGAITNNGILLFNRNSALAVPNAIAGSGALEFIGSGTITLSGNNVYTGTTTVTSGTLATANGNAIGDSSAVTVGSFSTLSLGANETIASLAGQGTVALGVNTLTTGNSSSTTFSGVLSGLGGGLIKQGAGSFALTGSNTYSGATTVNAGTLATAAADRLGDSTAVTVAAGATLTLGGAETLGSLAGAGTVNGTGTPTVGGNDTSTLFSGLLSGTGSFVKAGTGTMTLGGSNNYPGSTTVLAGTLATSAAERLPNGSAVTVAAGAALTLAGSETIGSLAGGGNVSFGFSDSLTLGGNGGSTVFSGVMTAGTVIKQGAGTFTLTGSSNYGGGTNIAAGVLEINGATATAGTGPLTFAGGTTGLLINGSASVANTVQGNPFIQNTSGNGTLAGSLLLSGTSALQLFGGGTGLDFSGNISGGTDGVQVNASGNVRFFGTNTYGGPTTVSGGTLRVTANGLPSATNLVLTGANPTLDLFGNSISVASLSLLSGTLSNGTLSSTSNFDLQSGTVSAVLAGNVGLAKTSSGTVTMSGANTYTGATSVSAGTLQTAAAERIPNSSGLSVAAGATLSMGGNETVGALNLTGTLSGTGTMTAPTYTLQSGATVNANLGGGTLTVGGNTTLNGTAAAGTVNINAGSLTLGAADRLADSAAVTVASGATLVLNGNDTVGSLNLSGSVFGVGTLTAGTYVLAGGSFGADLGAGTLIFNGSTTFSGTSAAGVVNVNSGTVTLGSANRFTASPLTTVNSGATLALGGVETLGLLAGAGTVNLGTFTLTTGAAGNSTFAGTLTGSGGLNKEGTGLFTLTGSNTYTGTTTVSDDNGRLILEGAGPGSMGPVVLDGGRIVFNNTSPVTLASLSMVGGWLAGSGNVTVAGAFNVGSSSAEITGTGTFITPGVSSVNLASEVNGFLGVSKPWVNTGTLTVGGDDYLAFGYSTGAGGTLTNGANGVVNLATSAIHPMNIYGGTSVFNNAGTLNQTAIGTHSLVLDTFTNTGTVNVQAGTLGISAALVQSGLVSTSAGTTFETAGSFTNTATGFLTGVGTILVGGGSGTLTNQGSISPGLFPAAGTLNITGNVNLVSGGTLDIDIGGTFPGTFSRLAVTGNVAVGGQLAATLIGNYNPAPADFVPFLTRTGTSSGNFASLNLPSGFSPGYNLAAGEGGRLIFASANTKVFSNAAGDLNWATPANWGGALPTTTQEALISAGFGVQHATGTDSIAALTVNNGSSLTVSGGSLAVSGTTTLGGVLLLQAGSVTLNGTLAGTAGTVSLSGGTLTLNGAATLGSLSMGAATLAGTGNVTLGGFNVSDAGVLFGSGALVTTGVSTVTMPTVSGGQLTVNKTWLNSGTLTVGGDDGLFLNAPFTNTSSGVLNLNTSITGFSINSGSTVSNAGTLNFSTPGINTLLASTFTNTGAVNVTAGTLAINSTGSSTDTGAYNIAAGAGIAFAGGVRNLSSGASVGGGGRMEVTTATLNVNTPLTPGAVEFQTSGSTINFNDTTAPITVAGLSLTGGSVGGTGDVIVTGTFRAQGTNASITGAGTLTTLGTGTIDMATATAGVLTVGKTWTNSGVLTIGGDDRVALANGRVFSNVAGGTVNLTTSNATPLAQTTTELFNNAGVLNQNAAGTHAITVATWNNTGTVNVNAGTLSVAGVGSFTQSGLITTAAGTVFENASANFTNGATGVLAGTGTFRATSGALNNLGTISPGTVGGAGTLTIGSNLSLSTGTLNLDLGGPLQGSSDRLAVAGNVTLGGTVNAGLIGNYVPSNADFISVITATGTSTGTFTTSNLPSNFTAGYNLAAGEAARLIFSSTGVKTFSNAAGDLNWATASNWGGTLPGAGNDVLISSGFTVAHPTGTDTVATLTINNANGLNVSGGSLTVSGATALDGTLTVSGTGSATLAGALSGAGAANIQAGTLTLNTASGIGSLAMAGGTLAGSGDLDVSGAFTMTGSTVALSGTGTLRTAGATSLNMAGQVGGNASLSRPWINTGTVTVGGDDRILINPAPGGLFTNAAGGVLVLNSTDSTPIAQSAAAGVFNNVGTLNKTSAGTQSLSVGTFNNSGSVNVIAGTLSVPNTLNQSGQINTATGTTFQRSGGFTNAVGGTLSGNGTFNVGTGTLTNQGTISPGASPGTVTIDGDLVLASTGTLNIEVGGPAAGASDRIAVNGNVTLGGSLVATLVGGYVPVSTDFLPVITATGTSSGTFASTSLPGGFSAGYNLATNEALRLIYAGSALAFTNAAGDLNWATPANWGGRLPGASDSALISAGFAVSHATGTDTVANLAVSSGNALAVSGGSLTVTGPTSLGGSLSVSGSGVASLQGAVSGGGTVAVSGGTLSLAAAANFGALSLTGGLFDGTGSFAVNGSFSRSGGTLGSSFSSINLTQTSGVLAPGALTAGSVGLTTLDPLAALQITGPVAATAGDVVLNAAGTLAVGAGVSGQRLALTAASGVLFAGTGSATASATSGDTLTINAGSGPFTNGVGASALATAGAARWLVYSANPANDTVGGLATSFRQYNASFGSSTPAGSGNGLLYSLAPTLTVALQGAVTKVYDRSTVATLAPGNYSVAGALAGDAVVLNNPTAGTYTTAAAGTGKTVQATGIVATASDTALGYPVYGYQFNSTASAAVGTVTAAPLLLTGSAVAGKVYDATTAATLASVGTVTPLAGDVVALAGTASAVFANKNVGLAKPVALSGLTLTGADANNYSLVLPTTLVADITARPLAVTGLGASNQVYNGGAAATLTGTASVAPLGGDTVTLAGTGVGSFANKNVGTAKPVVVIGYSLGGADAGNYLLLAPTSLAADITPAVLSLQGLSVASKTYDGSTASTASATLGGVVAGDNVSLLLAAQFADRNAGTAKPVNYTAQATGVDAANYTLASGGTTTGNITQALLTYAATPATAPAALPLPPLTGTVLGLVPGDTLANATTGSVLWTTLATANSAAGVYAITGSGLAAPNYNFTQATLNATALRLTAPAATPPVAPPPDPVASITNTSLTVGLQQVQVALAMSTPVEGRVLDVTPALASATQAAPGAAPSFRAVNFSLLPRDEVQSLLAARDKFKKQTFSKGLFKLEQDPTLADVRPCKTEAELGSGNCLITEALKQEIQAIAARAVVKPRKPDRRKVKQAVLPNIERKLALLIGINKYNDNRVPELTGSVLDARAVRTVLETRLGYETTVVEDASRESIIRAFNKLALEADANDSVIIYYAGHGEVVETAGTSTGYWLPADVNPEEPSTWLSNADIARMVLAIGSRQLMLISDSCYSGTLAGGEKVQVDQKTDAGELLKRKAAVVMSSGGNEPVADEGREGHSFFAWHLMRALEGLDQWQVGGNVFERVRAAVVAEKFPQTPQYGASRPAGHQGNTDYLFERREFELPTP